MANTVAVKVDNSGVTQPVSGTVTANAGTGTFTVAGTVTANAGTGTMNVSLANTGANATAIKVDGSAVTQPVSGTVAVSGVSGTVTTTVTSGTVTANSAAEPFIVIPFAQPYAIAAGTNGTVNVVITNNAAVAQDVYATINGHEQ